MKFIELIYLSIAIPKRQKERERVREWPIKISSADFVPVQAVITQLPTYLEVTFVVAVPHTS